MRVSELWVSRGLSYAHFVYSCPCSSAKTSACPIRALARAWISRVITAVLPAWAARGLIKLDPRDALIYRQVPGIACARRVAVAGGDEVPGRAVELFAFFRRTLWPGAVKCVAIGAIDEEAALPRIHLVELHRGKDSSRQLVGVHSELRDFRPAWRRERHSTGQGVVLDIESLDVDKCAYLIGNSALHIIVLHHAAHAKKGVGSWGRERVWG